MKTKLFGHRARKSSDSERTPGRPYNNEDYEDQESYKYVKSKDNLSKSGEKSKDNPENYEGKEHVKYKDPGYSSHKIRFPEDEPHMKSHVSKQEMHEMEDNYHMDVPNQTKYELEAKIKRAKMKMDDPHQEDPKPLMGNLVQQVGKEGIQDTTGEEEMGPNDMQSGMSKENRKKMIVAVTKKKMQKKG